jgi:cytochrome c-type biogenesis protein CcmF
MIPELGHFALIVALATALLQGTLPLLGAHQGRAAWVALARPAARAQALLVALAYGCLTQAFITGDFSVKAVAEHSNTALPLAYRVAAVWGGHEGSILLWVLVLAGWTLALTFFSSTLPARMVARLLGVLGLLSAGFLAFTLFTSNPFARLLPAAAEGRDLNPMLQDPGMVLHPPLLYMGYVGFAVAFAFAISALLAGRLDAAWARAARPWALVAWCFLTLGIALGSYWAYYELGWGGWWFWDPVENASLLPWLAGTALLHSLAVTDRRGSLRPWTLLLAIVAFSLSLLGTFIVRSGVLSSVHAFANDPARGLFILAFMALVVGGSLLLFAWRAPRLVAGASFAPVSREAMLLTNNLLLLVAAAAVLLGTLYPLVIDALGLGKLSVGPPYFESVFVPLMAPALFLMGIGPITRWRQARLPELALRLRWALAVSLLTALLAPWALGHWTPMIGFGLLLSMWVASSCATSLAVRLREHPAVSWRTRIAAQPAGYWGMLAAHLGIALFVAGVTLVKGFELESDLRLEPGGRTTLGAYEFRFDTIGETLGPNYIAARATIQVSRDGRPVATLAPERRVYVASGMALSETAIASSLTRDLYVALNEPMDDGSWGLRLQVKPFVVWIWSGCVLMALGGALALADRRYRRRQPAAQQQPALAVPQWREAGVR